MDRKLGSKLDIAVIDFETTGFSPYNDEPTEVAVLLLDGQTGEEIGMFDHLIKIKADNIPEKVQQLTGITKEMTEKSGLPLEIVKVYLQEVLKDKIVVAHNYSFEAHWLDVVFDIQPKYFFDTLAIDRILRPQEISHKLGDIAQREKISLIGAHRAMNDVKATTEVFYTQMNWHKDNKSNFLNTITTKKGKEDYRPKYTKREEPC